MYNKHKHTHTYTHTKETEDIPEYKEGWKKRIKDKRDKTKKKVCTKSHHQDRWSHQFFWDYERYRINIVRGNPFVCLFFTISINLILTSFSLITLLRFLWLYDHINQSHREGVYYFLLTCFQKEKVRSTSDRKEKRNLYSYGN